MGMNQGSAHKICVEKEIKGWKREFDLNMIIVNKHTYTLVTETLTQPQEEGSTQIVYSATYATFNLKCIFKRQHQRAQFQIDKLIIPSVKLICC